MEKKIWEDDYEARREELDAKWANEKAEEGEWRRLNRTDKERFLDEFTLDVNGRTLHLEQGIANSPACLGLTVWDASLVLTSYLETKHKEGAFGRGTKAIEFGSGCGVVGIAAATLGATVTATDCQWVIPLTLINVEKNKDAITAAGGSITCRELFWGRESDWEGLPGTFDCLIAADCVYTDTCVPELLRTMYAIATEDTQVLVAFQEHNPDASRAFWALVEDYFTFQRVPLQRIDTRYRDSGINLLEMKKRPSL